MLILAPTAYLLPVLDLQNIIKIIKFIKTSQFSLKKIIIWGFDHLVIQIWIMLTVYTN